LESILKTQLGLRFRTLNQRFTTQRAYAEKCQTNATLNEIRRRRRRKNLIYFFGMKEYKTFLKKHVFLYIIWPLIIHFIYESHQTIITQAWGFARSYMPYLEEE